MPEVTTDYAARAAARVIALMGWLPYKNPDPALGMPMILTPESMRKQDAEYEAQRVAALDLALKHARAQGAVECATGWLEKCTEPYDQPCAADGYAAQWCWGCCERFAVQAELRKIEEEIDAAI